MNFHDLLRTEEHDWKHRHLPAQAKSALEALGRKDVMRAIGGGLGLKLPELYMPVSPLAAAISEIGGSRVPRFVIKPNHANGSVGVRSLTRLDNNDYRDILSNKEYDGESLLDDLRDVAGQKDLQDTWIVEELLVPPHGDLTPIDDFKFYCFYGNITCVLHKKNIWGKRARKALYRWYNADWEPVDVGKYNDRRGHDMVAPENRQQLSEAARQCSAKLPVPFMRVDLYDTSQGVVFGELTPRPGQADQFNDEWDGRLIGAWREAAARLSADVASGRMTDSIRLFESVNREMCA